MLCWGHHMSVLSFCWHASPILWSSGCVRCRWRWTAVVFAAVTGRLRGDGAVPDAGSAVALRAAAPDAPRVRAVPAAGQHLHGRRPRPRLAPLSAQRELTGTVRYGPPPPPVTAQSESHSTYRQPRLMTSAVVVLHGLVC